MFSQNELHLNLSFISPGLEKNFNQWDPLIEGEDDNLIKGTNVVLLQSSIWPPAPPQGPDGDHFPLWSHCSGPSNARPDWCGVFWHFFWHSPRITRLPQHEQWFCVSSRGSTRYCSRFMGSVCWVQAAQDFLLLKRLFSEEFLWSVSNLLRKKN